MARQRNIILRGSTEGLIFYERDGKGFVRTKPGSVKQSPGTKTAGQTFGMASRLGKSLREALAPLLPFPKDKDMMNRLNAAVYQSLLHDLQDNHPSLHPATKLKGFNFNFFEQRPLLQERLKPGLGVEWRLPGSVLLTMPAINPMQDIAAPTGATSVCITMMAASCSLKDKVFTQSQVENVTIDLVHGLLPVREFNLNFTILPASLCVVGAAMEYNPLLPAAYERQIVWMPAGIVDAMFVG